jgi:hypothetical protein
MEMLSAKGLLVDDDKTTMVLEVADDAYIDFMATGEDEAFRGFGRLKEFFNADSEDSLPGGWAPYFYIKAENNTVKIMYAGYF